LQSHKREAIAGLRLTLTVAPYRGATVSKFVNAPNREPQSSRNVNPSMGSPRQAQGARSKFSGQACADALAEWEYHRAAVNTCVLDAYWSLRLGSSGVVQGAERDSSAAAAGSTTSLKYFRPPHGLKSAETTMTRSSFGST